MQLPALSLIVLAAGCAGAPGPHATSPHAAGAPPRTAAAQGAPDDEGRAAGTAPPALLVHVDVPSDPKRRLAPADQERLRAIVQEAIANARYATDWPGGLPSMADLANHGARAFIVSATIDEVAVQRRGARAAVDCTVMVRIAPWNGIDGGEHWQVATAAIAKGRGHATTSTYDERRGIRDCVLDVGQEVTTRQILPFLARLDPAGD